METKRPNKYQKYRDKMKEEKGPEVRGIRADPKHHDEIKSKARQHAEQLEKGE